MTLFDRILEARGLKGGLKESFLIPDYSNTHDPFLLSDMQKAVSRIVQAKKSKEKVVIYGDYDIDGLTASTLLLEALKSFGLLDVEVYIPNRFTEGYGMTIDAVEKIAARKAKLIITVDCGSSSMKEVEKANELGIEVIVTDHHTMTGDKPKATALINPKKLRDKYPFKDLAGVGVTFKLVQALQTKIEGLSDGQEKWLLDLVALGTVCDVVSLTDENRIYVYWGLKVLAKTRRPGLKALMAVAGIDANELSSRALGFGLGPRLNAAGRLENAMLSLELLLENDRLLALEKAEYLDGLNKSRRSEQNKILKEAEVEARKYNSDPVLVLSSPDWSHGIAGIVASKLMENEKKPVFVLQELGEESKGSARSFGDFNVINAVMECKDLIKKGGGHQFAAGVTLPTKSIDKFRKKLNEVYKRQDLKDQSSWLLPIEDAIARLDELTEELIEQINQLEPFGIGNPQPILKSDDLYVKNLRKMGDSLQHLRLELGDSKGRIMQFLSFNAPDNFIVDIGEKVSVWYQPVLNEWNNRRLIEGKLLHIEVN